MSKALVLIDFENEWLDENSDYYVGNISQVIERTNKLIDFCRSKNYAIIFVKHVEKDSKVEFVEDSHNVQIISDLRKDTADIVVKKYKISAFYQTDLEEHLGGIHKIVVCGILSNLCVRSFIHDAYDRDFDITVIKNCCVSFDSDTQDFTFNDLKATRDEIEFLNLDDFLGLK